jgi:hypothetical protein
MASFQVVSWYLPGGVEEIHKNLRIFGTLAKVGTSKYKSEVSSLEPVCSFTFTE